MTSPLCTYAAMAGSTSSPAGIMTVSNPAASGELGVIIIMRQVLAGFSQTFSSAYWTQLSGAAINNGNNRLYADVFYSTTHDGSSVTITSSYTTSNGWVAFSGVFTGFDTTTPLVAGSGNGSTTNRSGSGNGSISLGTLDDYLWLDFCATSYGGTGFNFGYPGNMPDNRSQMYANSATSSSSSELGVAMKSSNASSFTSYGWSFSNNCQYLNRLLAIKPGAAAKKRSQFISLMG